MDSKQNRWKNQKHEETWHWTAMAANSRKKKKTYTLSPFWLKQTLWNHLKKKIKPESHQGFRGNFQFLENIKLLGRSERNMLGNSKSWQLLKIITGFIMLPFYLNIRWKFSLKKKSNETKKTKQQQNPEERDVSLLSSLFEKKAYKSHFSRWYKSLLETYFNSTYPVFSLSREVAEETHFPFLPIYKYVLGGGEKGKNYPSILFFLSKCS